MHAGRLIGKHFTEGLEAADEQQMRAHLRQCSPCRDEYDRAATLLRAAAGRAPTDSENDALWRRIAAATGEAAGAQPVGPASSWAWPLRYALATAAVATAAVAGWVLLQRPASIPERAAPRVQLRGGSGAKMPLVALEVFAIAPDDGGYAAPWLVEDGRPVSRDAYVQFRYRNDDPALGYAYLFGLDERWLPLDYFPRPDEGRSISVQQSSSAETIGRSIRLSARHRVGSLWICAVFSERPLIRAQVHGAVARLARDGRAGDLAGRLDRLLGGAGKVASIVRRVEITAK